MIDFVSTHPSAHPQTVSCARLLAAVIAQAIDDASSTKTTIAEAYEATNWLFDDDFMFTKYAHLIGANAQAMREAMLEPHKQTDVQQVHNKFDETKRRRLRQNHAAWLKRKAIERSNAQAINSERESSKST